MIRFLMRLSAMALMLIPMVVLMITMVLLGRGKATDRIGDFIEPIADWGFND